MKRIYCIILSLVLFMSSDITSYAEYKGGYNIYTDDSGKETLVVGPVEYNKSGSVYVYNPAEEQDTIGSAYDSFSNEYFDNIYVSLNVAGLDYYLSYFKYSENKYHIMTNMNDPTTAGSEISLKITGNESKQKLIDSMADNTYKSLYQIESGKNISNNMTTTQLVNLALFLSLRGHTLDTLQSTMKNIEDNNKYKKNKKAPGEKYLTKTETKTKDFTKNKVKMKRIRTIKTYKKNGKTTKIRKDKFELVSIMGDTKIPGFDNISDITRKKVKSALALTESDVTYKNAVKKINTIYNFTKKLRKYGIKLADADVNGTSTTKSCEGLLSGKSGNGNVQSGNYKIYYKTNGSNLVITKISKLTTKNSKTTEKVVTKFSTPLNYTKAITYYYELSGNGGYSDAKKEVDYKQIYKLMYDYDNLTNVTVKSVNELTKQYWDKQDFEIKLSNLTSGDNITLTIINPHLANSIYVNNNRIDVSNNFKDIRKISGEYKETITLRKDKALAKIALDNTTDSKSNPWENNGVLQHEDTLSYNITKTYYEYENKKKKKDSTKDVTEKRNITLKYYTDIDGNNIHWNYQLINPDNNLLSVDTVTSSISIELPRENKQANARLAGMKVVKTDSNDSTTLSKNELNTKIENVTAEISALTDQKEKLDKSLKSAEKKLKSATSDSDKKKLNKDISEYKSKIDTLKKQITSKKKELESYKATLNSQFTHS